MNRTALIRTKIQPCLVCGGEGFLPYLEPYTQEIVPRECHICQTYGNLEGGHWELFGEKTASFRRLAVDPLFPCETLITKPDNGDLNPMLAKEDDVQLGLKLLEEDKKARAARREKAIANRKDHEARFTDMIINALESGSPLGKWTSGHGATEALAGFPTNFATKTGYRGVNFLALHYQAMEQGWSSHWATRKQWHDRLYRSLRSLFKKMPEDKWLAHPDQMLANVTEEFPIVFFKPVKGKKKDKATGKLSDKDAWIPMMRFFTVINMSQIDIPDFLKPLLGLQEPKDLPLDEREKNCQLVLDDYLKRSGVTLKHGGSRSYNQDRGGVLNKGLVMVPERKWFESPSIYWAHIFHELVHSTGHSQRLNRPKAANWASWTDDDYEQDEFWEKLSKDDSYAREELVAEMGAGMLCMMHGFDYDTRHASYLKSWLGALRGDTSLVMKMATAAQKAIDMILGTEFNNKEDKEEKEDEL